MSTMTSPLISLSEELIDAIISHTLETGDLLNLALVSRQLYRITALHLYGSIELILGKDKRSHERLHSLAIALLDRSKLAGIVRHLEIRNEWGEVPEPRQNRRSEELHPVLKRGIETIIHDRINSHMWEEDYTGWDSREALIAVILRIVPNLRSLVTNLPRYYVGYWSWLMDQLTFCKALLNLEELAIVNPPIDDDASYRPFLYLPRLKSAFFYNLTELSGSPLFLANRVEHSKEAYEEYLANASTATSIYRGNSVSKDLHAIEHLEFRFSHMGLNSLIQMIGDCAALRTFSFDINGLIHEHPCIYNVAVLALTLHAETLTALYIGDDPDEEDPDDRRPEYHLLPDFHKLVNLRYLKIPVTGLIAGTAFYATGFNPIEHARDRFPPSLQELTVILKSNIEAGPLPELHRYFQPSVFPNLKILEVHTQVPEAVYSYMRESLEQHNIQLRIFRRVYTAANNQRLTQFASSFSRVLQGPIKVEHNPNLPVSRKVRELFMPVEEFVPMDEIVVTSF